MSDTQTGQRFGQSDNADKVDWLVRWGVYWRGRGSAIEKTAQAAMKAMDPRATRDDYNRRYTRLEQQLKVLRADDSLEGNGAFQAVLSDVDKQLHDVGAKVDSIEKNGGNPSYGRRRKKLKELTDILEAAVENAEKVAGKRADDHPHVVDLLETIGSRFDQDIDFITAADLKAWRREHKDLTATFFAQNGKPPDIKMIMTNGALLLAKIDKAAAAGRHGRQQVGVAAISLSQRAIGAAIPRDQRVHLLGLVARAENESKVLDFAAAAKTLQEVKDTLNAAGAPVGAKSPDLAGVEKIALDVSRRLNALEKDGLAELAPRIAALRARIDIVMLVVGRKEEAAAPEAWRMALECQGDVAALETIREDNAAFKALRPGLEKVYLPLWEEWAKELDDHCQQFGLDNGSGTEAGRMLAALRARWDKEFPKLLTNAEFMKSGFMQENDLVRGAIDDLKAEPEDVARRQQDKGTFRMLADRVKAAVEAVRGVNTELLVKLDLLSAVPKLTEEGEIALGIGDATKVQAASAQLTALLKQIESGMAEAGPDNLENIRQEAQKQERELQIRMTDIMRPLWRKEDAESLLRVGIRSVFGKVPLVRKLVGQEAAERAALEEYRQGMAEELRALETTLQAADIGVLRQTRDAIAAFAPRVDDLAKRASHISGSAPKGSDPGVSFKELTDLHEKIAELIADKLKDYPVRANDFSEWNATLMRYGDEMMSTDPARMEAQLKALEKEILDGVARAKTDKKEAEEMVEETAGWINALRDDKLATRPGSKIASDNAAFIIDLRRRIGTYRDNLVSQKRPDRNTRKVLTNELNDLLAGKVDTNKQAACANAEAEFTTVRNELSKLVFTDLKLEREKAAKDLPTRKQRKNSASVIKDLIALGKEGLADLDDSRDVDGAKSLMSAIRQELAQVTEGGLGDLTIARRKLTELNTFWEQAATKVHDEALKIADAVAKACDGEADTAFRDAATALRQEVLVPIAGMFDPRGFSPLLQALKDDDTDIAAAREDVLREVRRLRNLMRSDRRIDAMAAVSPFGMALPITEIADRLKNIEKSAVQFS